MFLDNVRRFVNGDRNVAIDCNATIARLLTLVEGRERLEGDSFLPRDVQAAAKVVMADGELWAELITEAKKAGCRNPVELSWARDNHEKAAGTLGHVGAFETCPYPTCNPPGAPHEAILRELVKAWDGGDRVLHAKMLGRAREELGLPIPALRPSPPRQPLWLER
jgi:hypothetical protein